jgi:twitching motility two-component system response regulator PilH
MTKKILIVDDSTTDQANLRSILTSAGCVVISAASGAEALAKARAEQPAVIFMDIVMPEMDGFEACRQLTADPATKNIPVVFVSSKGAKADKVWGQLQGAKGYIVKPARPENVIEQLNSAA